MPKVFPELKSSPIIKRYEGNPILSMKDIPYDATCIFNAGITKYNGKYVMVFRNDVRTHGYGTMPLSRIDLGLATSDDGIHWTFSDKPFIPQSAIETDYEVDEGMRQNVIFPGGMILEDNGEVEIYYGASDTVECLATANVDDLINLCIDEK